MVEKLSNGNKSLVLSNVSGHAAAPSGQNRTSRSPVTTKTGPVKAVTRVSKPGESVPHQLRTCRDYQNQSAEAPDRSSQRAHPGPPNSLAEALENGLLPSL